MPELHFQAMMRLLSLRRSQLFLFSVVGLGLVLRVTQATTTFLNPDEAIFFFAGSSNTVDELRNNIFLTQHAPLFIVLLHFIQKVSSSELALRLVPVLAGGLFPWVVYRWLGMVWSRTAGLVALVILTFSPTLVSLSAQVRGYALVLLLAALGLLWLDTAVARRSIRHILLFTVALHLALLTEYSAAFFAGAAACYFLVRLGEPLPRRLVAVWAVGQASAIALCIGLYLYFAADPLSDPVSIIVMRSAFPGAYPEPGQSLILFWAFGTARQFSYLFGSHTAGVLAMPVFAAGLMLLWTRQRRALAVLLLAPILIACVGVLVLHPYGRTRHTVILSLFIAIGVAIAVDRLARSRTSLGALLLLVPVLHFTARPDINDIPAARHRRDSMLAAIRYLRTAVPPEAILFADGETGLLLYYYLRDGNQSPRSWQGLREVRFGSLHMVANRNWDFGDADRFTDDLAWLRQVVAIDPHKAIWVADGGFTTGILPQLQQRYPDLAIPETRDFDGAIQVFTVPAGL